MSTPLILVLGKALKLYTFQPKPDLTNQLLKYRYRTPSSTSEVFKNMEVSAYKKLAKSLQGGKAKSTAKINKRVVTLPVSRCQAIENIVFCSGCLLRPR